jgi:hypothetical protein
VDTLLRFAAQLGSIDLKVVGLDWLDLEMGVADLRPVGEEEKVDHLHPVGEALHPDLDSEALT